MTETFDNKIETSASEILYLNEEFADVNFVFKTEGEGDVVKVPANKAILGALSPVFRAMFFGELKEKGDVDIVDATADGFKEFLQFFHLDSVQLNIERIDEVVKLADKYDMVQYINSFINWFTKNLTPTNVCFAYQLAIATNNEDLMNLCEGNIAVYTTSVFAADSFVRCNQIVLKQILEMENLQCDEATVFRACLDWAAHACKKNNLDENKGENMREMLGDCLYLIRFGAMKTMVFAEFAQSHESLFTPEELVELFFATTTGKYKSNKFKFNARSPMEWKWNKERKIVCIRKKTDRVGEYKVQKVESVWFSTNKLVLLGELTLQRFSCKLEFDYNLSIVELPKQSFDEAGKVLYNAHMDLRREDTEPNRMCKYYFYNKL